MRRSPLRSVLAGVALLALVAACGDGSSSDPTDAGGSEASGDGADDDDGPLAVAVASYDLAVGDDRRLIAGVLSSEAVPLAFGEVEFQLGYLGEEPTDDEVDLSDPVTASYLPVAGLEPESEPTDAPVFLDGEAGTGVYEGRVAFPEAGFYGLRVRAELEDGTVRDGQAVFEVQPETLVPDVGDPAPRSVNLTVADVEAGDATPVSVDSRAQGDDAEVPDTFLHDSTVADAIDANRPVVVILSTPTYCVSTFCGPLTEVLADLAPSYDDTVDFVHIEVWRDFEERALNDAAAEWLETAPGVGNEPWVFLVDEDGDVEARWDNVLDLEDLETRLASR